MKKRKKREVTGDIVIQHNRHQAELLNEEAKRMHAIAKQTADEEREADTTTRAGYRVCRTCIGAGARAKWARRKPVERSHCFHGHALTPENTYITKRGHRACRECHRTIQGARYHALHSASARRMRESVSK